MKKFAYMLEIVILFFIILPYSLNYAGNNGIVLPLFDQIKSSFIITSANEPSAPAVDCGEFKEKLMGFPFVHQPDKHCNRQANYSFGLWLDYGTVLLIAVAVTKITSMIVGRFTKDTEK